MLLLPAAVDTYAQEAGRRDRAAEKESGETSKPPSESGWHGDAGAGDDGDVDASDGRRYTLALREVALDEAVERFVDATGTAVSYDPTLVRGRTASCRAEKAGAEEVLRCILSDSGLDFYRLSSGTYVLTETAELEPQPAFVAGRVTDQDTGSPLADSHVYLANADLATVTNQAGRFTFPALLPGRYILTVTHLGYRSYRDTLFVAAREHVQTEASLRSEPIFITPVVIDGLRQRTPSQALGRPSTAAADGMKATSPAAEQESYGQLRALPGVRINDVTADVHVQGGESGAHQFRLDGVPVFLPRRIAGLVAPFSSFALEKITVHKAGFGAAQGSQLSGLMLAEHALSAGNDLDVQVDPMSLNARLNLTPATGHSANVVAMAAARVGLWDVRKPSRLAATLDAWSRPDPFLLVSALDQPEIPSEMIDPAPSLGGSVHPTVHFSDVHGAARVRFGPLSSVHASFYEGRQHLAGGVFADGREPPRLETPLTDVSVVDDYSWTNRLAQIRYETVLASRTLAAVQLRGSRYRLQHEFLALDSLHLIFDQSSARLDALTTSPESDGNSVSTFALEGTIDHARGPHQISIGVESGRLASRFDLKSVHFASAFSDTDAEENDTPPGMETEWARLIDLRGSVNSATASWYGATYIEDRVRLSPELQAELGVRLTYLDARRTVYAEPRAALRFDRADGALGPWATRTSAGLYRQFLNQTDVSKLNAGALLPSVRVWLPVDGTVRPPTAYHLAQEVLFNPIRQWSVRLEGYLKVEPHNLTLAYAQAGGSESLANQVLQAEFLVATRGVGYGGHVSVARESTRLRAEARYAYGNATRKSGALFGGARHPAPWNEPHRLELGVDWMPMQPLALSARWRGVWGRAWGFRQTYYDYFGHDDDAHSGVPYDLGDPGAHVLPALYQFDLSASYTRTIGPTMLQVRAEVINVLDRDNVLDWRLIREAATWRKDARTLYPRIPAVAVRLRF